MKKRILFVCNYFAPENTIAAVRTTKLVKYFSAEGFRVDVITEKKNTVFVDETLIEDIVGINIYYAENSMICSKVYNIYKRLVRPYKSRRMQNLDNREKINPKTGNVEFFPFETAYPIIGSIDYLMGQLRQKNLAKNADKIIKKLDEYDFIITSYGDSFSYFVGKKYKNRNKNVMWIFDIRDAVYRYKFTPCYVKWLPVSYEKYVWKHADAIVGVSKGICKRVPIEYGKKVHYIPNGYEQYEKEDLLERLSSKMCFTYTGSMYGGLQNMSAFFIALKELIDDKKIERGNIEVHYAGNESAYEIFRKQAGRGGLEDICIFHGKISRNESMQLQRKSDVLLMASYDYKKNCGGIITGKLLEYMGAERPVISVVTGDIENSEVSQIIEKTNIGFCYEESNKEQDQIKLKDYILMQYTSYLESNKTIYRPNDKEKERFNYYNLSQQYIKLINKLEEES